MQLSSSHGLRARLGNAPGASEVRASTLVAETVPRRLASPQGRPAARRAWVLGVSAAAAAGAEAARHRSSRLRKNRRGSQLRKVARAEASGDQEATWRANGRWAPPARKGPAAWLSQLSFSWVSGLLRRSTDQQRPPLEVQDVTPGPPGYCAEALARELSEGLPKSIGSQGAKAVTGWQLMKVLGRINAGFFLRTGILRFVNTVIQFLPALFLGALLAAVEHGEAAAGMRAAAGLCGVLCVKTLVEGQFFYHSTNVALRIRSMLQAAIYQKSLRLPELAAAVPPVTLMQVDTGKVEELAYSIHTLWDGIFQVLGYSFLLVHYLGKAGLTGLLVLFACLPLNALLSRRLSTLNREALQASDTRVSRTSEILSGIRAIRQMGWEDVFAKLVRDLREVELVAQRRRDTVGAYLISYFSALPPVMITVVLSVYVAGAGSAWTFRPSTVFTALSVLNQIRFPLLFYPYALDALAEGQASLNRLANFMSLEEVSCRDADSKPKEASESRAMAENVQLRAPAGRYPLATGPEVPELVIASPGLEVRRGELLAVIGPVGSGKSSLVRALLGELPGLGSATGKVVFCAQTPWVPSGGTFRDIVTIGMPWRPEAFARACEAALVDFAGADDEVSAGTLSGGQQARTALARCVYHAIVSKDPEVQGDGGDIVACVLDDVAAALDPQVSSLVMERCVFGELCEETRIVVTSDTGPFLRRCDRVVVMESLGSELRLKAVGSYAELSRLGLPELNNNSAHALSEEAAAEAETVVDEVEQVESQQLQQTAVKPELAKTPAIRITVQESRAKGAVPAQLYRRYLRLARSPILLTVAAAAVFGTYLATTAQQWWIGIWTSDIAMQRSYAFYLAGVSLLGLFASALTFGRALLMAAFARRASRVVHSELCESVLLHATTRFFDANPTGRLLQNFSKDLEQVDSGLPGSVRSAITCIVALVGTMATISLASPSFMLVLGPLGLVYWRSLQYYRPAARELNRLLPLTRSPVYAEQVAAAAGVATIRQLRLGSAMSQRALGAIDQCTATSFASKAVDRWFSLRMEMLGNLVVFSASVLSLSAISPGVSAGNWAAARAAIAVTQALSVVGLLNWTVRTVAQTETSFSSFQRVAAAIDETESEAAQVLPADAALSHSWPEDGAVVFRGVSLRYRDDLPLVLRDLNLHVPSGQRVGVVGRTGSGKSTLLRVLLRTLELEPGAGSVTVDGVDIQKVGLSKLRSSITVIPQENFLISGTVRQNVDPRNSHSDEDIRRALADASLQWDLDRSLEGTGGGISPGERQLLGVARAVLRRSRIVALDEVTSRVDEATDRQVQAALRRLPEGTTLLVVSHRLATLEDYDLVVVMDGGQVAEVGNPRVLQRQPGSRWASLLAAESAGNDSSEVQREPQEAFVTAA